MNSSGGNNRPVDLATILHAAHAAENAVETRLSAVGLSLAKLSALKVMSDAGESLPLTQLAERLSCVKSNITQLVDRLEADGFVAREADPRDRRTRLAALTPAGRKAVQEGTRVLDGAERDLLRRLTDQEAHQLNALLRKVGTAAG
jgi:DNA-binding MarR family transcriptional regulator